MVLRRIALILVALVTLGFPLAAEAFTTVDLAGTWSIRALSVSGSAGGDSNWTIGTLTLDATGTVTGGWTLSANSSVSEPIVSGSFTITADGHVTGSVTDTGQVILDGQMLGSRNIMVLTHEAPASHPDRDFGLVALVRAPAVLSPPPFTTADFAGTWRIKALKAAAGPGGDGGSAYACCIVLDDTGHVTGGELSFFDEESRSLGGDLVMAANGSFTGTLVTWADTIDTRGVMVDNDLGVAVFTLGGTDDGYGMFFLQRAVDAGFPLQALVGTWQLTQMHVDEFAGNVGGWVRGNLTVVLPPPGAEECGCAVVTGGTFLSSDGNVSHAVSGGVLVMDGGGLIAGFIATDDDSAIYLEAVMGASKDYILGVDLIANTTDETLSDGLFVLSKNAAPSSLQLGAASYTVGEAVASHQVTITVKRTGSTASSATVDYATADLSAFAGTDYTSQSGTLTFPVGSTTQTFTVPITNNTDEDGARIFRVLLSNPVGSNVVLGSPNSATVTITDDETGGAISFAVAAKTVSEGAGSLSALVTRAGTNLGGNVTVPFSFSGTAVEGTDYSATAGVLSFGAGVTSQSIPITLLDTAAADGSRTLIINLQAPSAGATLGAIKTMIITITDNEQSVAFSAGNYSVTETVGAATLRVNRAGAITNQVMVQYQTVDGTAHAGLDYGNRSGTLTFDPGVTFQTLTVPIVNNTLVDGTRAFGVQLFGPAGGGLLLGTPSAATVLIGDNDAGGVFKFAGNVSVVEGGTASLVVTRTVAAGTVPGNASVTYSVIGGTAPSPQYAVGGGTLTFGAGEVRKTIPVATVNDFLVNGSRTVMVALGSPSTGTIGTPGQATVTIIDDDKGGQIQFAVPSMAVPESAGAISLLVTRLGTKLAGNVTVPFSFGGTAVNGFDYSAAPGVLTFAANQSSASIFLTILDDLAPDGDRMLTVDLGTPAGGASLGLAHTATVKILDNEQSVSFSSASYAVSEAAGRATIRVNRTGATTSLVSVQYETLDGTAVAGTDYGNRSGTLTFPVGSTFQTFTVPILNNTRVDGARSLTLSLFDPAGFGLLLGNQSTATLVINDDDTGGLIRFAANTSVTEGGTAALSVIRSGVNLAGNVSVTYGLAGGTAPASDYSLLGPGTLTFGPGETSKKILVSTVSDALFTGARTVLVDLCCASGGGVLGTPSAATVRITDNDSAALVRFASAAVSVLESAGIANLTVLRSGNMAANVTVPLTYAGTAVAGADYAEPPASLTLLPGQASASIPITLFDDALTDGSRTLIVTLGPPGVGAALGVPASTTLTIRDDEATVQFTGKWNGNSPEVVRSGVTDTSVTVHYQSLGGTATDGVDYGTLNGTLTFGPGVTKQYIPLQIRRDNIAEGPESFTIELSAPTGGAHLGPFSTLPVTIQDNDDGGTVNFASAQYFADAGSTVTVTVKRTGGLDTVLLVNFTTSDGTAVAGTDYSPTSGTLSFGVGQTTKTFTVETLETWGFGSASLELHLSVAPGAAVLGGTSSAILTISGLGEGESAR